MSETIDYKSLCAEYERRMGIGEHDPTKEGYLVLVKILKQQNEFLSEFAIKSKISSEEKADATMYKNAKDLWEQLPDMIKAIKSLRIELKMDGEEKKDEYKPVSAKAIANGEID
jgi:hypothetical protein